VSVATEHELEQLRRQVEQHLSRHVRRFLDSHAGDVVVKAVRPGGEIELEFKGACTSCPALPATFYTAVAPLVREVPGVTGVTTAAVNVSEAAVRRLVKVSTPSHRAPSLS
jgi:Fe-S cluster biogenesis protein NfuA